ncbi:MAG: F-type H+-transporting ATPase subunit b [Bacteriovoracaceae bacterium]|jgi:F-type H+-transporting ATPase subunit b
MKTIVTLIAIAFSGVAFAAGGTGPSSLLAPAVNVTILICALVYFLRTPAKNFFNSKSSDISEMLQRASSKAKEAELMMEVQKKKNLGAEKEIQTLESEQENLIKSFEKNYISEVKERVSKMKEDAGQKIEAEKKELINELNSNLLDLVIQKAKGQIKTDKSLAQNATKNIVEGL